jgi:hypothetical protein
MKKFFNAVCTFFAVVFGLIFFFRKQEKKPVMDAEKLLLKIKLKEIEAANELEANFKNKSDRQIVLDAIDAETQGRGKPKS